MIYIYFTQLRRNYRTIYHYTNYIKVQLKNLGIRKSLFYGIGYLLMVDMTDSLVK